MRQGTFLAGQGEPEFASPLDEVDVSRNRARNIIPRFFVGLQKRPDTMDDETDEVVQSGGYREVEYVELLIPGDKNAAPVQLVDKNIRRLYSDAYKAFKEGRELPAEGTPIEFLFGANDSRVHVLKSMHIRTAEALSELSDQQAQQIGMGGREMRKRAQAYLETQGGAKASAKITQQQSEIDELKSRLAALEAGGPVSHVNLEDEPEGDLVLGEDLDDPVHGRPSGASPVGAEKRPPGAKPDKSAKKKAGGRR